MSDAPRSHHVACKSGLVLHVREWGRGAPTCLLIHGFGEGCFVWDDFAAQLSAGSMAIDLRGHGDSQWDPQGRYDVQSHTRDVVDVIDALDPGRVLIGHSLGANVGIRVAAARPDRVSALVIVDSGPEIDAAAADHIRTEFNFDNRTYPSVADYAARLEQKYPLASPVLLQPIAAQSLLRAADGGFRRKCDPAMGRKTFSDTPARHALWSLLGALTCPTLVIRGALSSVLTARVAERMTSELGNGRLAVVARAGHAVMLDEPDAFAAAAAPFVLRAS